MHVIDLVTRKSGWEIIAPNLITLVAGLAAFAAHTHARGQDGGRRGVGGDDLHSMEGN